jgi:hypothetical protein
LELGSLRIGQGGAEHETFYASPAACLGTGLSADRFGRESQVR